jgi:2-iminobutanoate/2-iminopropanoate deaminase
MVKAFICVAVAALLAGPVLADGVPVKRIGDSGLISEAIWAGDTLYVSGMLADADVAADSAKGTPATWTSDTKTQGVGTLQKIEKILKSQGLGLGDCVQMQVFLVGDPKKGDVMDFAGWNEAYKQFFGTASQPNKPVRVTMQIARLAAPGALVEVMVTAVRSSK